MIPAVLTALLLLLLTSWFLNDIFFTFSQRSAIPTPSKCKLCGRLSLYCDMRIKTLRHCEKSVIMTAGSYKSGCFHIKRNVKEPHNEVEEIKSVTNQEISGRNVTCGDTRSGHIRRV